MVKQICSNCELLSDKDSGQFNLLVKKVRLGEDEDFECQVLPGHAAKVKVPLRASVHINIQGNSGNDIIESISLLIYSADPLAESLWPCRVQGFHRIFLQFKVFTGFFHGSRF